MPPPRAALLQMHACVLLWGFTAILGKLIALPALALVWWRMLLVAGALLLLPRVWCSLASMGPRLLAIYAGIGVLVALHWLTFYGSIKLANASVAVTCMALAPVFVAIAEPLLARRPLQVRELLLGVAVIPGVALVVGGIPGDMLSGMLWGIVSALLVALFGILNKQVVERADALGMTCAELGAGAVFLTLAAPWLSDTAPWSPPGVADGALLLVLAFACTLLPFALSLVALRHLSAFTAQMTVNLEPVYAIVLAWLLLGEQRELAVHFYVGVAIVLGAVFAQPLLHLRRLRSRPAAVAEGAEAQVLGESPGRMD